MGNAIAKENSTINWNNVKTDNFSDNNQSRQLSNDSKLLVSKLKLNIPEFPDSESDNLSNIFTKYQTTNVSNNLTSSANINVDNNLSDTSPFISSEMYNYLLNKNNIQSGGNKQKGGAELGDDSSTSSTSSSSNSSSSSSDNKKSKNKKSKKEESESEGNDSELSYVSSPGESENSESKSATESEMSGGSISNDNNDIPPSSINTSDINMISESS
jgi:hypothetical protein